MVDLTEKDQTKITALTSPVKQQPASSVGSKRVRWEPASAKSIISFCNLDAGLSMCRGSSEYGG